MSDRSSVSIARARNRVFRVAGIKRLLIKSFRLAWSVPMCMGILASVGFGAVFFVLRVSRYDLFLALDGSDLVLPIKLVVAPKLLVGYHVRDSLMTILTPVQWVLASFAAYTHVDPFVIEHARLLALNVMATAATWALSWALFRDRLTAVLSVLLVVGGGMGALGLAFLWNLGEFAEWHYFGLTTGLFVVYALYRQAYVWASFLVGLLFWMHPSHTFIAALLTLVTYVVCVGRPQARDVIRCGVAFLLAVVPAVVYLAPKLTKFVDLGLDESIWWAFMRARKSHHLFPFSWSWRRWAAVAVFIISGLMARRAIRRMALNDLDIRHMEWTTTILLITLGAICLGGVIFSEIIPLVLPTKLALCRASNYPEILLALYLCRLVRVWLSSRILTKFMAGFALAIAMIWLDLAFKATIPTIFLLCLIAFLQPPMMQEGLAKHGRVAIATVCIMAMTFFHVYLQAYPRLNGPASLELLAAWRDIQLWARINTPKDSVFVNPPAWCGFEVFSDRASIISICDVGRSIYSSNTAVEELRRIRAYSEPTNGVELLSAQNFLNLERRYETLSAAELRDLASAFGATYAIMPKRKKLSFPHAYQNSGFVVYQLKE